MRLKKNGYSDINYILIHGDEETARMLLNEHIQNNQGRAFLLNQRKEVPIGPTIVDPNRIFSRPGAEKAQKSLKQTGNLKSWKIYWMNWIMLGINFCLIFSQVRRTSHCVAQ